MRGRFDRVSDSSVAGPTSRGHEVGSSNGVPFKGEARTREERRLRRVRSLWLWIIRKTIPTPFYVTFHALRTPPSSSHDPFDSLPPLGVHARRCLTLIGVRIYFIMSNTLLPIKPRLN